MDDDGGWDGDMDGQAQPLVWNPWVPEPPREEPVDAAETAPSYVRLGPTRPMRAGVEPPRSGGLPVWTPPRHVRAPWWWVACHGGAGSTTLAAAVGAGLDAERRGWPVAAHGRAENVVLVARTHVRGLAAAQEAARQWASGAVSGVELLGLVAVADAPGKLPKVLRDALRFVAGGVPRVWHVPWVEGWRTGPPNQSPKVRASAQLAADLGRLAMTRQREAR